MFCKNCGNEIKQDIKFCPNCGTECMREKYLATESENDTVIRRIDCAKGGLTKAISIVIVAVYLAILAYFYMSMGNSTIEIMGKFFLFLALALAIYSPFVYMTYQKRFCLIKENSVSGIGCGATDFTNCNYEFKYSEVISVQKKKLMQQVVVQTANKKISVFLPKKEINNVYEHILSKSTNRVS